MTLVYLGYGNPKQATRLHGVLILHEAGETRVLMGRDARDSVAKLTALTHHFCGVKHDADAARLIAECEPHKHDWPAYNALFAEAWEKGVDPAPPALA